MTYDRIEKPWGWYQDNLRTPDCVMKIVHVKARAQLSLQSHKQRSEVWGVRTGTATVVLGETLETIQEHTLQKGETISIPRHWIHRLKNDTDAPVEVAEIQLGTCDETDIERYEDDYGREGTNT